MFWNKEINQLNKMHLLFIENKNNFIFSKLMNRRIKTKFWMGSFETQCLRTLNNHWALRVIFCCIFDSWFEFSKFLQELFCKYVWTVPNFRNYISRFLVKTKMYFHITYSYTTGASTSISASARASEIVSRAILLAGIRSGWSSSCAWEVDDDSTRPVRKEIEVILSLAFDSI